MAPLTVREEVALAVAAVVALALLVRAIRRRRALVRRLAVVATRLEHGGSPATEGWGGVERALARLEHAADEGALRVAESSEAAHRLSAVLDQLGVAVLLWDDVAGEAYSNEHAAELQGEPLAAEVMTRLRDEALAGRPASQPVELFGPPPRTLAASAFPLDDGRRTTGAAVVVEDVTARRRLEAMRRELVDDVARELAQPVVGIELLADTVVAERDPVVIRRLLQRLRAEAGRANRAVADVLELVRLETAAPSAGPSTPIGLVVAEAVDAVRPEAAARNVALDVEEPPAGLTVIGDRRQLASAIRRLVDNAVRYSNDGGKVSVKVGHHAGQVGVVVRDEGMGIAPRDLGRVFERFYRTEGARARHAEGAGLGLSIAAEVAAAYGGQVAVDSEEGGGSIFTLRLPAGLAATALKAAG
jgi:two-component system sensor histidine kinase SenX3